jgi:GNAT superfamily N-acetyltransferase
VPIGDPDFALPALYAEHAARARAEVGLTFRDVDLRHLDREVDVLWDVYNAAWERNWGFVPMTRREFEHLARDLKPLADARFAFVAEVRGEPAGFALALLDYNVLLKRIGSGRLLPTGLLTLLAGRRGLRSGRVMALGVKREHRTRSVFALFAHELVRRGRAAGVTGAEASWVLEDNHLMNRPLRAMGGVPYRRWRLYERPVGAAAAAAA